MPGMLVLLSFLASLLLSCLCFPSVWASITGGDEFLDAHEAGLAVVASRTPFRESGPPACMAKLIMLRHKVSSPLSLHVSPVQAPQLCSPARVLTAASAAAAR
ncbi:uncharacterized protein BXZ73DRAFT_97406 [Epithele typhae]|uniref:uncharacterized protein n=1 Tax=Epithele typhae TaxID=378194 RepID=UPI002007A5D4|nr:uncharacterized protein BXZ73DRAFT_97406 [Epithele typhae]KAH9943364.1 hypothetical protein BXZ73DRAFT_97406 [Epithele typhae]